MLRNIAEEELLPTPMTSYSQRSPEQWRAGRPAGNGATRDRIGDLEITVNDLLPTPTATLNEPAPWKEGVDWWLQSRATRNLEGVVTGNTPLLGTPTSRDWKGASHGTGEWKWKLLPNDIESLPTPTASDWKGPNFSGSGSASSRSMATVAELLPTPNTMDDLPPRSLEQVKGRNRGNGDNGGSPRNLRESVIHEVLDSTQQTAIRWGPYEGAIRRWEAILGRPAPIPTEPGKLGKPRLSPALPEFMLGLPAGWVTDVPGLSRKEQLTAIGNGVCIQQAALALRILLDSEQPEE